MMNVIPLLLTVICTAHSFNISPNQVPFVLNHHPDLCEGEICYYKNGSCWGYESICKSHMQYGKESVNCESDKMKNDFWKMVDFGYIKQKRDEIVELCSAQKKTDSFLHCSRHMRYCVGRNIYLDFHKLSQSDSKDKFREDLFDAGDIGGFCKLNNESLHNQGEHKSPLQSWFAELQNFTQLQFKPLQDIEHCDVIINETVVFMKLDYGGNMFHHFCDFFNLYASQHVNSSWFGRDISIVMWDTATSNYYDPFATTWKVFSDYPMTSLMDLKGKRVCVRDVMFPLLARMRGGMYYNTYVPGRCVGSNLFRAFSEHIIYRMKIPQNGPLVENNQPKIRLTLLQRGNPKDDRVFRQIKNQDELVKMIEHFENIEVKIVEYNWRNITFEQQLRITHNSDIFIGMHGAGLAHFLFLPDWAVAFELYNCGDQYCYYDLARLRGLHYMTWPQDAPKPVPYDQGKHYRYGDNPKFWNWEFDPEIFKNLVSEARNKVLSNDMYQLAVREKLKRSMKQEL